MRKAPLMFGLALLAAALAAFHAFGKDENDMVWGFRGRNWDWGGGHVVRRARGSVRIHSHENDT